MKQAVPEADIAFIHAGSIRAGLPRGEVRAFQIKEMLPFDNYLVVAEMSGANLRWLINRSMNSLMENYTGTTRFLQFSTDVEAFDAGCNDWTARINGIEIDLEKTYTIVTVDFIVGERGYYHFFFEGNESLRELNTTVREAVQDYLVGELH
jgi:2',3'-cyclic-nucleotide 2'-phosphodiesterase (5'-nucleotidase family)